MPERKDRMILELTRPVQGGLRQEIKLDIIANNLANADTAGFKADFLAFDNMLRAQMVTDHSQGDLKVTGNKLDIALADEGYFAIQTQNGVRYTRNGNFTVNNQGELVTQTGNSVLGDGGTIVIEGSDVNINGSGEIQVEGAIAGRLKVVTFENIGNLKKEGNSLFVYEGDAADEKIPEDILVKQGALEMSNISTVVEMAKLIETQRMYEAYKNMIQTFDEINGKAISEVGRMQ